MAKCTYCGSTILLGGVKDGDRRYCNANCQERGVLFSVVAQLPPQWVEEAVNATHGGNCPKCQGRGPVDVHTSHRVWSALVMTSWASRPQVCCGSCGWKAKVGDACFSLFLGWWGFPWGIIFTPVQIGRNLIGLAAGPKPGRPSEQLKTMVALNLAAMALEQQAREGAAAVPPPLPG